MNPAYRYRARLERVKDGDTYVLRIDLGFYVSTEVAVRLRGVDCPELGTPEGRAAREAAFALLHGQLLVVESYRGHRTFERWVCDVWLQDGRSLAATLVEQGHATASPA